jgi:hypothetical protein
MLTLDPLLVLLPAAVAGLGLLGYAGLLWQRRKAEKAKPKPIPVSSRRRRVVKDNNS